MLASSMRSRSVASDTSAGEGSITPALATTRSNSRSIASSAARSATSAATASPPSSDASAAIRSARRATSVTCAPAAARARAVAAPIPEEAPVMTAVRFVRSMPVMVRRVPRRSQASSQPRTHRTRLRVGARATLSVMAELGDFLRSRRARLHPQDVGLPDYGRRRVPGLRREELAQLAGVSVDYYVRLEQGRDIQPSDSVLDAIATALRLDDAERAHLFTLVRPRKRARRRPSERVRPAVQALVERMQFPAFVLGRRMDVLAANGIATALMCGLRERNMIRFVFLDGGARSLYPE